MKIIYISIILFFLSLSLHGYSQNDSIISDKFWTLGITLKYQSGLWGGTVPAHPENESTPLKYDGLGYGINIDYRLIKYLGIHFDILNYSRKTNVAYKDGCATSDWVWEMTDYQNRLVGPFDNDYFYFVNAAGMRLGVRLYLPVGDKIKSWYGIYYSFYTWYAGIYNKDKTYTYGNVDGNISNLSYLNLGIEIPMKNNNSIDIFAEFGAPVVKNYEIHNCIIEGWTFKDYGEGFHIFGYNRFGIALNISPSIKKK